MRFKTLLSGHSLSPGVVVLPDCPRCQQPDPPSNYRSKPGHGACTCGVISEHEATHTLRRAWHTRHKAQVRAGIATTYFDSQSPP